MIARQQRQARQEGVSLAPPEAMLEMKGQLPLSFHMFLTFSLVVSIMINDLVSRMFCFSFAHELIFLAKIGYLIRDGLQVAAVFSIPNAETEGLEEVHFIEPPIEMVGDAIDRVEKFNSEGRPWYQKRYRGRGGRRGGGPLRALRRDGGKSVLSLSTRK